MPKKSPKEEMKCGEIRKSSRPDKKLMQRVCKDGSDKLIHAGDSKYSNNDSAKARANFKARHNCDEAKPGTPKHLACNALWKKGGPKKTTGK